MLILVGVSVSVALNGGLFKTAKEAADKTKTAIQEETSLKYEYEIAKATGKYTGSYDEYVLQEKYGLKIGDPINYDETNFDGYTYIEEIKDLDWVVFGIDDLERVEIISTEPTSSTYLFGSELWGSVISSAVSPADVMDKEIQPFYGRGRGALECRAMSIDDINNLTGFNPVTDFNGYCSTKYTWTIFATGEENWGPYAAYYTTSEEPDLSNKNGWEGVSSAGEYTPYWTLSASEKNVGVVNYVYNDTYHYTISLEPEISELIVGTSGNWKNSLISSSVAVCDGVTSGIFKINNGAVSYFCVWTPGGYAHSGCLRSLQADSHYR